jgi:hypothetical protein
MSTTNRSFLVANPRRTVAMKSLFDVSMAPLTLMTVVGSWDSTETEMPRQSKFARAGGCSKTLSVVIVLLACLVVQAVNSTVSLTLSTLSDNSALRNTGARPAKS